MPTRLIRILTADEMLRLPLMGGGTCVIGDCAAPSMYMLATPLGDFEVCDECIDGAIASLPSDWIAQWEEREALAIPDTDDIPF